MWLFELLVAAPLAAGAISMLFADSFWFGDVLLFFLPWVAFAAFLLFALSWVVRLELVALACALLVLVSATLIAQRSEDAPDPLLLAGTNFRVATFNTFVGTIPVADLAAWLRAERPDVIALEETFPPFKEAITTAVRDLYPYQSGLTDDTDVELLSRHPISSAEFVTSTPDMAGNENRILRAVLDVGGQPVIVYAVHAQSPRFSEFSWDARNDALTALAERTRRDPLGTPIIVAGDFNAPPWSPHFEQLTEAGLVETDNRLIPLPTRFVDRKVLPVTFGASVDHILVSRNVGWTRARLGPDLGSDHRPVVVDLVLYGTPIMAVEPTAPTPPTAPEAPKPPVETPVAPLETPAPPVETPAPAPATPAVTEPPAAPAPATPATPPKPTPAPAVTP